MIPVSAKQPKIGASARIDVSQNSTLRLSLQNPQPFPLSWRYSINSKKQLSRFGLTTHGINPALHGGSQKHLVVFKRVQGNATEPFSLRPAATASGCALSPPTSRWIFRRQFLWILLTAMTRRCTSPSTSTNTTMQLSLHSNFGKRPAGAVISSALAHPTFRNTSEFPGFCGSYFTEVCRPSRRSEGLSTAAGRSHPASILRNSSHVVFIDQVDGGASSSEGSSCTSMTVPSVIRPTPSSQARRSRSSSSGVFFLRRKSA